MGFMDKVKEQAEKAKVQAQDLKGKVGDKVEEVQGKRKADELLDELGRFLYAEQTGRPRAAAETEIPRLVAQLKSLEDEGVAILPETPPAAPSGATPEAAAPEAAAAPEQDEAPGTYEAPDASMAPAPPPPLPGTPA